LGPLAPNDPNTDWPLVASRVAEAVARGEANEGIVCCWTGTGACIAANKVPGIRAALVHDAETARGALYLESRECAGAQPRATSIPLARRNPRRVVCHVSLEGESTK
jgi:ribose 5-phosphate isomerase B